METRLAIAKPANQPLGRIVAAARESFAESGVEASRMEDIAKAAGISRAYLYRFVAGRDELIEHALLARLEELGAELAAHATEAAGADDITDAFIDQLVTGVRLGSQDPEFAYLAEAMPRARLNWLLTATDSPIHDINARAYNSLFARALSEGTLRTNVSADAMVEWIQGVMVLFSGRGDLDEAGLRSRLRDFVLPSIIR